MRQRLTRRAGAAIAWRMAQLGGVKVVFLVRTIILARILVPDDFGLLAVSLIAVDVLQRITNLGMVPALIQQPDAGEDHYAVAWTAGVVRALAIAAIVWVAAPTLAGLFGDIRATNIIRVVAWQPLLEALSSIKVAEITRQLRFRELAIIAVPESVANAAIAIALAPSLGVWALVAGALVGKATALVMSYVVAPYRPRLAFSVAVARPLIQFGRWIFVIGLVMLAGNSLLQVVISRKLGAGELGLYFLAARLAFLPAEVSGEVIGAVAFPLYAQLQANPPDLVRAFRAIYTGMLALLMPASLLLVALASPLATHVLGPQWQGSVPLIRLLALVSLVGLLGDSIVPILQGIGRPAWLAVVELVQSALLIGSVWLLADRFGVVSAGIAWLIAVGGTQVLSAILAQRLLPQPFAGLGRPVLVIALIAGLGAGASWATAEVVPGLAGLIVAGLLGLGVSGLLLWAIDRRYSFGLAANLAHAFPQVSGLLGRVPADG